MFDPWFLTKPEFEWRLISNLRFSHLVENLASCGDKFHPNRCRKFNIGVFILEGARHFHDGSILTFHGPVLIWCIGGSQSLGDPILLQNLTHITIIEFPAVVTEELLKGLHHPEILKKLIFGFIIFFLIV